MAKKKTEAGSGDTENQTPGTDALGSDATVIDADSTAPSKGDQSGADSDTATATELNSKERLASRTGRGNGGDAPVRRSRLKAREELDPSDLGERETVSPADHDVIWTNKSKDRWDNGQPPLSALLKQHADANKPKD